MTMPTSSATPPTTTTIASSGLTTLISTNIGLIHGANNENDKRLVSRILYSLSQVRRQLDATTLISFLLSLPSPSQQGGGGEGLSEKIITLLVPFKVESNVPMERITFNPQSEPYICLLCGLFLLDKGQHEVAAMVFLETANSIEGRNRRFLDPLLARCYFFFGRAHELAGQLGNSHGPLMLALRLSSLRHDSETYATVYNTLLRLFTLEARIEEAYKLISCSPFPTEGVSGANQARFHYYVAGIHAVRTDYVSARESLIQALRKAPHSPTAIGFIQSVHKLTVVVQFLLGEIPERKLFRQPNLRSALRPYLSLAQVVRLGDLNRFQSLLSAVHSKFATDRTLTLIQRLHHTVLKAGLKRLTLAYSKIPLVDVQVKLGLSSVEDTAFVLLKAINDKVIEGTINYAEGYFESSILPHPYCTTAPQEAFNQRITALNTLHNDCLRAMRYPLGIKKGNTIDNSAIPTEAELIEEYLEAEDDLGF